MSDTYNTRTSSQSMYALRRTNDKLDGANDQIDHFMERQMNGEKPDPAEFMKLLEKQATAQQALQAQFKLLEKPMKTVLNETK
ncbi:hypothetical protein ACFQUU_13750 [Herbaspirillum sp. GCM10030257]|uniref:hypothetical protein n=1 Tax=Herbaspirillum sp. GCM10030257 TaxID=3273393 RepID=UPI00361F9450